MFSLSINRGALYLASTFTDSRVNFDIASRVWFERSGDHDIKMSALDGHMLITFLLKNANLEKKEFETFGLRITDNLKKALKPSKKDAFSNISLYINEEEKQSTLVFSSEITSMADASFNQETSLQISRIWERFKTYEAKEEKIIMPRVSTLNLKQIRLFDFSAFFPSCAFPAFVKAGEASVVNFNGLPENIEARGIVMHSANSSDRQEYEEIYGENFPDWLV